jgi:hypothetical protein
MKKEKWKMENEKLPLFIVTIYGCTIFTSRTNKPNKNDNNNQNKYEKKDT